MSQPGKERVDVIDEQGRVLGTASRQEMRAQRLLHRCAYILVFNSRGELLIHLRTASKDVFPSHWDTTIGGVLAAGESYDDGAAREVLEELGVTLPLEPLFPFRYADEHTRQHAMVYAAQSDGPFSFQEEEIVLGEFVPFDDIDRRRWTDSFCPDGLAVVDEFRRLHSERQL
jgi:isopentenyldiphosphate isomerase